MNDAQSEPLTDSEAEAVLVALSGRLQWEDVENVPPIDKRLYLSQTVTQGGSYGMQWYAIWKGT